MFEDKKSKVPKNNDKTFGKKNLPPGERILRENKSEKPQGRSTDRRGKETCSSAAQAPLSSFLFIYSTVIMFPLKTCGKFI